jgi:hypothetical protein
VLFDAHYDGFLRQPRGIGLNVRCFDAAQHGNNSLFYIYNFLTLVKKIEKKKKKNRARGSEKN